MALDLHKTVGQNREQIDHRSTIRAGLRLSSGDRCAPKGHHNTQLDSTAPTRRSRGGGEALRSQPAPSPFESFQLAPNVDLVGATPRFTVNPGPNQHPALQPCSSVHAPAPFRRSRPPSPHPRFLAVLPSRCSVRSRFGRQTVVGRRASAKPRTLLRPRKSGLKPSAGHKMALRARKNHEPGRRSAVWLAG